MSLERSVGGGFDLYTERSIAPSDRGMLSATIDADLAAVEAEFGRSFARRPGVYVFATAASFEYGLQVLFRYSPSNAQRLAAYHSGVLEPASLSVAINWRRAAHERPLTILRHELTHAMVWQVLGSDAQIPAWFDEGIASLAQRTVSEAGGRVVDERDIAVALVSSGRASLAELTTVEDWIVRSAALSGETYALAAEAVRLLREDIGRAGLVRILQETGRGASFETAFAAATGRSVSDFISAFPRRLQAQAVSPTITAEASPRSDGNVHWSARGFAPGAGLTVTIEGAAGYSLTYSVAADRHGRYRATFGSTAPAGTYAVRVQSGGTVVGSLLHTQASR